TGTITEGRFEIVRIVAVDRTENELLALAAAVERVSSHPLAGVIGEEAARRGLTLPPTENAEALPGRGVSARCRGRAVRAGNTTYLQEAGAAIPRELVEQADALGATAVWVAEDGSLAGAILLRDRLREGVRACVGGLAAMEIG